ncbi:ribosome small subunit-dependent GTPase A [Sporosarcina oncorhynchi]|uniref:Small ribosomal subunit biogenesis GTPase RsgA n=1 Tax=Sporosarcina oncorhynchi TaxID=3056444 RepID=A0ABZ0L784_9BACL|nr:ribosome small subunit-dependent GTPase A [Sporosarcina sp. T2O-4]WOV88373.1 ribosome small subunit-dependent GTPase A [Sporosarcina sp. T2O-4]
MTTLQNYGWNELFQTHWDEQQHLFKSNDCKIGRVTLEHKHMYRVITEQGEWLAVCSGSLLHHAIDRRDYPAVGDWVAIERMPGEERGIIHAILPRSSVFSRKTAGVTMTEQLIAVNVDIVFLVTSMNDDFNIPRLERYLVAAYDSGAVPVIVLTKADLCDSPEDFIDQARNIAFGTEVLAVSSKTGRGIDQISSLLHDGKTAALLGSSGVGKSSLVNAICGDSTMTVQTIREDDAKGRHTTTHRELIPLPDGGVLIDTPGMREFQLWNDSESVEGGFSDIEALSESCKFNDCSHKSEPGCAIQQALEDGELAEDRFASYVKLQREIAYLDRKTNAQSQIAERKRWKAITKSQRK